MTTRRRSWRRDDRGSASVELVILAPLFGLLVVAAVAVGRVQHARGDVEAAAQMAARELSIARDPHSQIGAAHQLAAASLQAGSPSCQSMSFNAVISVDRVDVTVTCTASLQNTAILPIPGSLTVTGTGSEVRDQWREAPP